MKLGTKLLLPPIVTALVALTGGAINGALMQREAGSNAEVFTAALDQLRTITSVQEQMGQMHSGVYRTLTLIASLDEPAVKAVRADLPKQVQDISRVAQDISGLHDDDQALRDNAQQVAKDLAAYAKQADQAIDLAQVDPNTGVAAMQGADASFKAASQAMSRLIDSIEAAGQHVQEASASRGQRNSLGLGLLSLLLTAVAVLVCAALLRRVIQALREASALAEAVADGDLSQQAGDNQRSDEIGQLQRSLTRMVQRLHDSLQTVRHAASSIATTSSEIATGNQDLSNRTEQTAGRLQQTASSMLQLTGSVGQSAEAAAQANQLASSAAEVAQRGGAAVAEVVTTMDQIQAASRKIGDIIGVIDGIAFQTNILALNAAVEAARAGEQGRGFAVVAGEVRSLAGRSAEAAREIKALIGASVDRVENGSRLVQDAGTTMNEIVESSRRVSNIIAEITASTVEQRDGIGQINGAVAELDQMTQQNAALVEESAAASDTMKQQALRLAQVVSTFQLGTAGNTGSTGGQSNTAPPPATPVPKAAASPAPAKATVTTSRKPTQLAAPRAVAPAPTSAGGDTDWTSF
ncbi:MAG TPA: methyl-accepting chemotaxis protein [Ideonella sp.]|uniref:methyl-accepting chemotaxis protein n=1 Tax=Ideonella sp. TaxID=1929293 RepID=UPI002BBFAE95|nr:methyl-accepting chemotaxis protein [Ideonella sp.]HSI47667.1 methyl-accepting chemotaxis protein [Ideonella sp.]